MRDPALSRHALDVIELERVLERIAGRAASDAARVRIRGLRPAVDARDVERELARVSAAMRFVEERPSWALPPIPDARPDLDLLRADGAVLEPLGIHRLGVLLSSSRLASSELVGRGRYPELDATAAALPTRRDVEDEIFRSVDEQGEVLGSASRELKRIRDRLRGAHSRIVRKLEAYLGTLGERFVVPDASVTIREGRYVIPVRREGKGEVGGIVHDESQTGATVYIEPPVAIELMNELRDLERQEAREIRRILGALTQRLAPDQAALAGALDALVDLDALLARARVAIAWGATPPEIVHGGAGDLRIRDGRHPLLLEAGEEPVVPFDLDLSADERCLVVSGPNTGGKSVLLKATGLIAALTQSGVVPPVGPGTRLPVYTSFFADIGDEQSIARSLSTFSAHLSNLADIVTGADERSLVLIDEMGTGTDPTEGAALARAVIDELVRRGATTLVTSHLGDLKRLDAEGSGIVNASLQFDADRMEPTYRLVKGRPGRSYGLAIARRLGFPAEVLDRAEAYRSQGAADLEEVLARLEQQERRAEQLVHDLDAERARTERLRDEVETRESRVSEAERTATERARRDARKLLLEARAEVEDAIRELRAAVERGASLDAAAKEARRRVELAADRRTPSPDDAPAAPDAGGDLVSGDAVRIQATGARGRLVEERDGRALVEVGSVRLEVPLGDLTRVAEEPAPRAKAGARRGGGWSGPERGQARTEVDLRGMRVDEMELELQRALDQAVLEDLPELRIIHGKGTGALRQRVGEVLAADARVRGSRMGGPTEGGAGVTVATLGGAK